jgi:hypothetical protein
MHEFDLLRPGSDSDLSLIAVQEAWMLRLQEFNAVVITPPCASYSRAQYANSNGPRPVRSAAYPLGFPWLSGADKSRAELGSNFAAFLWQVLFKIRVLAVTHNITGLGEHPEDLGRVKGKIPPAFPASIWQSAEHKSLVDDG